MILKWVKFNFRHCEMVTRNWFLRIYAQAHMDNTRWERTHQDALSRQQRKIYLSFCLQYWWLAISDLGTKYQANQRINGSSLYECFSTKSKIYIWKSDSSFNLNWNVLLAITWFIWVNLNFKCGLIELYTVFLSFSAKWFRKLVSIRNQLRELYFITEWIKITINPLLRLGIETTNTEHN